MRGRDREVRRAAERMLRRYEYLGEVYPLPESPAHDARIVARFALAATAQPAADQAPDARDAEIAVLREALEWYADPEHWVCPGDYCHLRRKGIDQCFSQGSEDRGDVARAALASAPAPREGATDA